MGMRNYCYIISAWNVNRFVFKISIFMPVQYKFTQAYDKNMGECVQHTDVLMNA